MVMAWLRSHRADWGVLSETGFSDRFRKGGLADTAAETARAESVAREIGAENARILDELSREFVHHYEGLFPAGMGAQSAHRKLREDIHRHYNAMVLALVNYAIRIDQERLEQAEQRQAALDEEIERAWAA
jgi:hypothetical protein